MKLFNNERWTEKVAGSIANLEDLRSIVASDAMRASIAAYQDLIDSADGRLPEKSKIDPMVLRGNLANVVLYDVSDPARVIFRIVGENMKSHFQINPVGRCYLDFVPEFRRAYALSAFRHCAELPCAMLSRTRQAFESGTMRFCEAVGFPLMGESGTGFATHLLFIDHPTHLDKPNPLDQSPFRFAHMLERHFVDLGYGVPDRFTDIVQDGIPNPFERYAS